MVRLLTALNRPEKHLHKDERLELMSIASIWKKYLVFERILLNKDFLDELNIARTLRTPRDFIRWANSRLAGADVFYGHGTDNHWDEALALVLGALHIPTNCSDLMLDATLTRKEKSWLLSLIRKRIHDRVPTPYLTGEAWFAGDSFFVDRRVLIPRSPLAQIIKTHFQPWLENRPVRRILDLCTGSGCIGIACANIFPMAKVDMVDCSYDALEVATKNISRHNLQHQVKLIQSDLFAELKGQVYDLIVCNPPYASKEDMKDLPIEYQYEPVLALEAEQNGEDCVTRIIASVGKHLSAQGLLAMELGNNAGEFAHRFKELPVIWPDSDAKGFGVFLLEAEDLRNFITE